MTNDQNFYYNPKTLQFEKNEKPFYRKVYNVIGYVSISLIMATLLILIFSDFWSSVQTKIYKQKINSLDAKYNRLIDEASLMKKQIGVLEKRDNDIYRTIFQADDIADSLREIETSNAIKYEQDMFNKPVKELYDEVDFDFYKLKNRIKFQIKSYTLIDELIRNKENIIRATPAIQPIANKDLSRIASGFGYRIDPIYKTEKFHEGLDFTSPSGSAIYATADGLVERLEYNGGYGNHIVINHGYGYKTLYGHLFSYETRLGKHVKRGEIIGTVGNTGKSTGPHCHYEVIKNNVKINPVYYFFNDISADQFEKITTIANQKNQSLD